MRHPLILWFILSAACRLPSLEASFVRGDVDGSGSIDISDPVAIITLLFAGQAGAIRCRSAADFDDDGQVTLADASAALGFLFLREAPPPAPFPACGDDPTPDALACAGDTACVDTHPFPPPEISAFGFPLRARAFHFIVDRSARFVDSGEFAITKRAVASALASLPDGAWVGIYVVDGGLERFPAAGGPALLDAATRALATDFVMGAPPGSGSCHLEGLLAAIEAAHASPPTDDVILYLTDDDASCRGRPPEEYLPELRRRVLEANQGAARIHTICNAFSRQRAHLEELAAHSGGECHLIDRS